MINEEYINRHWAETVRLFVGWLNDKERDTYIKKLAKTNILLATECRANIFIENNVLDEHLANIAINNAKQILKTRVSANGLLALAVLEKYEQILEIFASVKTDKNNNFYSNVISDFIRNANEIQIIELLKVLISSNLALLENALDNILDSSLIFSLESKLVGNDLLEQLLLKDERLQLKVICIFQLGNKIDDSKEFLYKLIKYKQIKYALRISQLTRIVVDKNIIVLLDEYVRQKENFAVRIFIDILKNVDLNLNKDLINLSLAKSLNPIIKRLGIKTLDGLNIDKRLAEKICEENIKLGNKSSIEFSDEIINQFTLKHFSKDKLIQILLESQKYQSIELAYNLIKKYSLYNNFNYRQIFNLLIGNLHYQSLSFARDLVVNDFPIAEQDELLYYVSALTCKDNIPNKTTKQILLNDKNKAFEKIDTYTIYIGHVAFYKNGTYSINIGNKYPHLKISGHDLFFKRNRFVDFRFIKINEPIENSEIEIISENFIHKKIKEVWFGAHYIGEIISLKITQVEKKKGSFAL